MAEEPRNYAAEAQRIVSGESKLMPEREHLVALVGQLQGVASNLQLACSLLAGIMVDNDLPRMAYPKTFLDQPAVQRAALQIKRDPTTGTVTVTRAVPLPEVPQPPAVM